MSLAFRITNNNFQDNSESNALKKAKMEDGQARATQQGQKRAALGTITNNAGLRIQPFRAAKQQVSETRGRVNFGEIQVFKLHALFSYTFHKPFPRLICLFVQFRLAWLVLRSPSAQQRTMKMHLAVYNKRLPLLCRRLHSKISPFM